MDHHYIPHFYLKQWADPDGRVPHYRWIRGKAVKGRLAPRNLAYEPDLYAQEHVAPEDRHRIETGFFSILDSKASEIYRRLLTGEEFTFTAEQRIEWAIFLAAANARTPDMIRQLKRKASDDVRAKLDEDPEEVESRLGYKPDFTLSEWVEKHRPEGIANFGYKVLLKLLTSDGFIQPIMRLHWTAHSIEPMGKEFLTCDRPLWYLENYDHPHFTIMLPLSPHRVFIASKSRELSDRISMKPDSEIVRRVNESMFNRAHERVYGRAGLVYVTKRFQITRRGNPKR